MGRRRPRPVRPFAFLATALVVATVFGTGCRPPAFELTVTFPGPLEIEPGADVRYQGVEVGRVTDVALVQPDPEQPAQVELLVAIHDPGIVLREDDLFEIVSDGLLGDPYLRVTPAVEASPPLERGARVAGVPPLATRVVDSAEAALKRLGRLAREQAERLVDSLSEEIDDESMRPGPRETPPEPDAAPAD